MTAPVELPTAGPEGQMWRELVDIAAHEIGEWTIVGALMVALHARAAGLTLARLTKDIDTVVEVRGVSNGPRRFARLLTDLGWDIPIDTVGSDGIGHRFSKGSLKLDLLAPEGIGERIDLTTIPPLVTIPIPGATQALRRTITMDVRFGDRRAHLPVPDLLGAIVIKSCAASATSSVSGRDATRHRDDLALLCCLVDDPDAVRDRTDAKDRRRIRGAGDPNWRVAPPDLVADGRAAHEILTR